MIFHIQLDSSLIENFILFIKLHDIARSTKLKVIFYVFKLSRLRLTKSNNHQSFYFQHLFLPMSSRLQSLYKWKRSTIDSDNIPLHRREHAAVMHKDSLFVWGGYNFQNTFQSEIHQFSFITRKWTKHQVQAPYHHSVSDAALVYNDCLYVFLSAILVMEFNLKNFSCRILPTTAGLLPKSRTQYSAVLYKDAAYTFGGKQTFGSYAPTGVDDSYNDMQKFSFKTNQWNTITLRGKVPCKRYRHTAWVHEDSMYIFGGIIHLIRKVYDMYRYDFKSGYFFQIDMHGEPPKKLVKSSTVFYKGMLFVLGGNRTNDLYKYDCQTNRWSIVPTINHHDAPSKKMYYAAGVHKDVLFLFGGSPKDAFEVIYEYNISVLESVHLIFLLQRKCFDDVEFIFQ